MPGGLHAASMIPPAKPGQSQAVLQKLGVALYLDVAEKLDAHTLAKSGP